MNSPYPNLDQRALHKLDSTQTSCRIRKAWLVSGQDRIEEESTIDQMRHMMESKKKYDQLSIETIF
jgi:uncharacterized protein (DUF2225 family)